MSGHTVREYCGLDDIMQDGPKEPAEDLIWPSSMRLTLVGRAPDSSCEDELGMYLESERRQHRKRRGWECSMDEREEKDTRRPPRKIMGASETGGGGGSSSSSHLSPGWPVNDLEIDLVGELSMNSEQLMSLPSLTVFKQEAPSPTGGAGAPSPPRRAWLQRRAQPPDDVRQFHMEEMVVEGEERRQQSPSHAGLLHQQVPEDARVVPSETVDESERHRTLQNRAPELQCQQQLHPSQMMPLNPYGTPADNKGGGLLVCSPAGSLDGFLQSPLAGSGARAALASADSSFRDDLRFQYVLAAATSIATRTNEETLTYLNQGQPYEIKLKKLGDLSQFKGKILKSVIKICFHERRLQYMEREQMARWHAERPGERVVEVDVPLSYGLIRVHQPADGHSLNCVEVLWDPTKDAGVYIKVNCISTEFTAKKHGGEKGVPFRVQVETCLPTRDAEHRLHAAACQIKVFKLKGADRKHKQDREKVMRRPRTDHDKYQPGCEATVLSTLPSDAVLPPSLISTSPPSSPEMCVAAPKPSNALASQPSSPTHNPAASTQVKQLYGHDGPDVKVPPACRSPGAILPDAGPAAAAAEAEGAGAGGALPAAASHAETQAWLAGQRFGRHLATFANFSGADLLRLSRDDLIQICDLADGIRLYNALHAKRIEPRLTVYVCAGGGAGAVYSAVYLHSCTAAELLGKLRHLVASSGAETEWCENVLVSGPGDTRLCLTDELVRHLPDKWTYRLHRQGASLLLTSTRH